MVDPELRGDETVIVRTPGIFVKSIPFEGILTNKRILLVDRVKDLLPPKEIPLATIKDVDAGENAIRDQIITISIIAKTGEIRQMILTFSRQAGGNRIRERDEWVRHLKERTTSSFEQAIRRVIPGMDSQARRTEDVPPPKIEIVNSPVRQPEPAVRPQGKKEIDNIQPMKRIIGSGAAHAPIPITTREPEPQIEETPSEPPLPAFGLYCSRCGNRLMEGSLFCNRCGFQVARQAVSPSVAVRRAAGSGSGDDYGAGTQSEEPPVRIAADPVREAIEAEEREARLPPAPAREPAARQKKPARASFLSRIFGPKKQKTASSGQKSKPAAVPVPPKKPQPVKTGRRFLPGKRTILAFLGIVIVIAIIAIGAVFIFPMISKTSTPSSGGSNITPTPAAGLSTGVNSVSPSNTFVVPKETAAATVPATGVYVHINYLGSWLGTYGMPSDPQKTADSGDKLYEVLNATGTVQASVAKRDSSTKHDLLVEIYRNGKLLTSGSTSAAYGSVTLSADVTTGKAQPPKTSGGAAPTTGSAVTTTAVPAAAKTTSPAANTTSSVH